MATQAIPPTIRARTIRSSALPKAITTGKVLFTTPLVPGNGNCASPGCSTWFALEGTSYICRGNWRGKDADVRARSHSHLAQSLRTGSFTENATVNDYQITPLSALTGTDMMTITAIPVPSDQFSATSFPNLTLRSLCRFQRVAAEPRSCVEVERDCSGTGLFQPHLSRRRLTSTLTTSLSEWNRRRGVFGTGRRRMSHYRFQSQHNYLVHRVGGWHRRSPKGRLEGRRVLLCSALRPHGCGGGARELRSRPSLDLNFPSPTPK